MYLPNTLKPPSLFVPKAKYWLWTLFAKVPLGFAYIIVVADGWRHLFAVFATRLSRAPFLAFLAKYKATERIDIAYLLAFFLMLGVFYFWAKLIPLWLDGDDEVANCNWKHPEKYKTSIVTGGVVTLAFDAYVFLTGVSNLGWRGKGINASSIIVTIGYVSVLGFVSFVAANLKKQIQVQQLIEEKKP